MRFLLIAAFSILERIDDVVTPGLAMALGLGVVTFSILERIDDVVTHARFSFVYPVLSFSILERIDDVVTDYYYIKYSVLYDFQYPRTDRRCCDGRRPPGGDIDDHTFSILERIDDVVTIRARFFRMALTVFQYPRTDRRCCDPGHI